MASSDAQRRHYQAPRTMSHVTSMVNEPFPSPNALSAATKSHVQGRFRISTRKLPISKSGPIDDLTERIGIPMPEMIFGDNLVSVEHIPTGWSVAFSTPDALDAVDKTEKKMLRVAYARDWESTREDQTQKIKEAVKPYDWSYSTEYKGTVTNSKSKGKSEGEGEGEGAANGVGRTPVLAPTKEVIPIELLKRRDPILFFDEVVLYESELDDNGISIYSAKLRVHERRMLLLCRLFMRLDNVLVRIRDTRIYVDFETDLVIRDYTAKEASFDEVKRRLLMTGRLPDDITISLRDPNVLDQFLKVVEHETEAVHLKDYS
ncbi:hypothetical protein GMORB2_5914 [Geosmithia morbida]|uniref:TipA protein n=1 Tax=Geosmithia morbida TaxID=1094350 RepID=A0A9P4YYW0_9HYPO|nr:uncharacterized protein GMORB2_5914 [Geosmithia morbida]KAF4124198.1 hypothetical protein GMORB2_5914 [Geosmithia morbida]